jgi:ubiquinone/menaquinone biosynthesis C-methylase UbiE
MSDSIKFDPRKLAKLNNPERFKALNPDVIWEALNLQNPKTLIDIGAGTGFFAKEFAKKIKDGTVYTCDSSEIMIQWMQENIADDNIIPLLSSETSVDLPEGAADLVYMINVHHELLEPEKLLIEAHRLLISGGKIAIIDWKAEEMDDGPPLEIRIPDKVISKQLFEIGFKNITNAKLLPLHSFIIGQK